jgi:hypothetical protein
MYVDFPPMFGPAGVGAESAMLRSGGVVIETH